MTARLLRDRIIDRFIEDFVGPLTPNESLPDRPTQRYSTGILYPRGSRIDAAENEDGNLAVNTDVETASSSEDSGVPLHAALKPSVAGLSFAIRASGNSPSIQVAIQCAQYKRIPVDEAEAEIIEESRHGGTIIRWLWRRLPLHATLSIELNSGESRVDLGVHGIKGLELYVLATPHAGLMTVTAAISNQLLRGESSAYDEEQHFFQVELAITGVLDGTLAPRPFTRTQTDDDSRMAALIYRDEREYVVGHTCSARAVLQNGVVLSLNTDWVPIVTVPGVSDQGDAIFDGVRNAEERRPLEAKWLVDATQDSLAAGLDDLVAAYRDWIQQQSQRIPTLPESVQAQARIHMERCERGAQRMAEGIATIRSDTEVCKAFQLAQNAMLLQFSWTRNGAHLIWRPFQLGFQLLALDSLAKRSHPDRDTMDLLWFPTGGGKTEAYLALTAFVVLLRRLRASPQDDGSGVSVLMRYTLRLLTIQQFQRAAAMILACELLRRRGETGDSPLLNLGRIPIGIGLWVGAAATPLTLKDACDRSPSDPSRPEQLTICPCCLATLRWRLTPRESFVECVSPPSTCELAASGARLPVWTIDEEVYRNAPSLLIGTVDKFAQIVRKPETRAIFGRGNSHSPPDLIIQDELHLISGPLGSIAGLYEVAIDELCRRDAIRPKIIGSTATIRRAEDQIRALFDRSTYQFPSPGLDASNSGFAVTDTSHVGRLYAGITTAGRSATYMLQALVASLLQAATEPAGSLDDRNYYWTLVTYFNSLRELGRALVLMQDDVPVSIKQFAARRGETPRRIEAPAELTSRVRAYEIRDMLERLSKPVGDPESVDLLVASNMISVGMDIPRLGLMVVNAQPKTLAEYIQATSRVGRGQVPGIVITMYNSLRARDRSRFETFETWHRSLYRDVEATSVTPFASRAQDKALHAVLVALVRHLVPGMERRPVLDDVRRAAVEDIAAIIEHRVANIDPEERALVSQKLKQLIDEWASRPDLQAYWDDYGRRTSLLMSAEQYAANANVDANLDPQGARRAMWATPNSMREVEAGTPFILRRALRTGGDEQ